jgi:hypothetical protein
VVQHRQQGVNAMNNKIFSKAMPGSIVSAINRRTMAKRSLVPIVIFLASVSVFAEDYDPVRAYVDWRGDYFLEDILVGFYGDDDGFEWPFDVEDQNEYYTDFVRETVGLALEEVSGFEEDPLQIWLTVNLLDDNLGISCNLKVEFLRYYPYYYSEDEDDDFYESVMDVVFSREYNYIDEEYYKNGDTSEYWLSEMIDKYFRQYVQEFVNRQLRYQRILDQG